MKLWLPVFIERSPAEWRMLGRHGNPSKIVLFVAGRTAVERAPELPACIQVCWQPPPSPGPVAQYQGTISTRCLQREHEEIGTVSSRTGGIDVSESQNGLG